MKISIIVAAGENNVIGKDNHLIWHLPKDLHFFKTTTIGHPIIMGRKTFESIGKALPGRQNIIITRQEGYAFDGCDVADSLDHAFKLANNDHEVFIAGGGEIYRSALKKVDRIYFTRIHGIFDGDTFFPDIDLNEWEEVKSEHHVADDHNEYDITFSTFERKS